jgi:hypothetical protein
MYMCEKSFSGRNILDTPFEHTSILWQISNRSHCTPTFL